VTIKHQQLAKGAIAYMCTRLLVITIFVNFLNVIFVFPVSARSVDLNSSNLNSAIVQIDTTNASAIASSGGIGPAVKIFEDQTGQASYQEVLELDKNQWQLEQGHRFNFGLTSSAYWFKFDIVNQTALDKSLILDVAYSRLREVDFYQFKWPRPDTNNLLKQQHHNNSVPFQNRPQPHRHFVFPLLLDSQTNNTILVRVTGDFGVRVPIFLYTPEQFHKDDSERIAFQAFYFGAIAIMVLYNLFIFFSVRDKSYLLYSIFMVSFAILLSIDKGWAMQYLWPDNPLWDQDAYVAFSAIAAGLGLAFAIVVLQLKTREPRIHLLFMSQLLLWILLAIASFFFDALSVIIIEILVFTAGAPVLLAVGVMMWKKGVVAAPYYVMAWVFIISGTFVHALVVAGLLPDDGFFSVYAFQLSHMIEAALLSFGLGARINYERKEKHQAQRNKLGEEIKRYEAERGRQISEEKNKAKTQFFASMSHEFRTPLTAILGYSELAMEKNTSEQEHYKYVNSIANSADHMLQLINNVLDISKIEAQQMDIVTEPVDLFNLSRQVNDFIQVLASKKDIGYRIDFKFPLPEIFISDPTRLKQALINLYSNSVKFTQEGSVTLHISCDPNAELLHFAVEDTGIGLRPEQKKNLFRAFSQADEATARNYGGTGLGLYLSKLIAKKLGGDISVESEFGQGSTFTLSVSTGSLENCNWIHEIDIEAFDTKSAVTKSGNDIVEYAEIVNKEKAEVASHVDAQEKAPYSVLLAEDNQVNQMLISTIIKKVGPEVVIANDGVEAIAHAMLGRFGLILMDLDMPHLEGLAVVKLLRGKGLKTPIYALTANVDQGTVDACFAAGCDGHLSKPLDTDKLRTIIASLV